MSDNLVNSQLKSKTDRIEGTCRKCKHRFLVDIKRLLVHVMCDRCGHLIKIQQPPKILGYDCERCGKTFCNRTNLRRHKNSVHSKNYPYPCPECPKESFTLIEYVRRHYVIAHGDVKTLRCLVCSNAVFRTISELRRHVAVVHLPNYKRQ